MLRISLTTWFGLDEKDVVLTAHGIVGHLTREQFEIAKGWIYQLSEWTDENRAKMEDNT